MMDMPLQRGRVVPNRLDKKHRKCAQRRKSDHDANVATGRRLNEAKQRAEEMLPALVGNQSRFVSPATRKWINRARQLVRQHVADLGGEANISTSQMNLIRHAATLAVELERRSVMFAKSGKADDDELCVYQTTLNTLRRTLESLGLRRRARDISPPDPLLYAREPAP